jgi:hypothetical protein
METLKVQNITISPASIRSAINALAAAIEKHTQIKRRFEEILDLQEQSSVSGRRGRPAVSGDLGQARASRNGRRRRRHDGPTLRDVIVQVLSKTRRPLGPTELKNEILAAGYKTTAKPASLYTAVFNTAKKTDGVLKTKKGFSLKRAAGAGGGGGGKSPGRPAGAAQKKGSPARRPDGKAGPGGSSLSG